MRDVSDNTVAQLRRGDPRALAELFHAYGDRVFNLCRSLLGNTADAEDATQEVFIRALEQGARFDGRSGFAPWLFRLAINHARNLAKAAARRATHSLSVLPENVLPVDGRRAPDEQAAEREESVVLEGLLGQVPLDQRAVLVLREFEQMSYQEISELLDIPLGTVTSRLVRARRTLKGLLLLSRSPKKGMGS